VCISVCPKTFTASMFLGEGWITATLCSKDCRSCGLCGRYTASDSTVHCRNSRRMRIYSAVKRSGARALLSWPSRVKSCSVELSLIATSYNWFIVARTAYYGLYVVCHAHTRPTAVSQSYCSPEQRHHCSTYAVWSQCRLPLLLEYRKKSRAY